MQKSSAVKPMMENKDKAAPKRIQKPKKKRKFIFLKILIFILICMLVFMSTAMFAYKYIMEGANQASRTFSEGEGQVFKISYGDNTAEIADNLKKEGYIKNVGVYKIISKIMGFNSVYKAGKYIIDSDMNYYALMLVLSGQPLKNPTKDIMIPEGKTLTETAQILADQGYIDKDKFLDLCKKIPSQYTFAKDLAVSPDRIYPMEGYLYPDTYKMDEGWTEQQLIDRLLTEFDRKFTYEYHERAKELGMTIDQVITLASLIEAEAKYPTDFKKISSVFHNRLKSDNLKLLQSDATVQYARLAEGMGRTTTVLFKDLELEHPYNTYIHPGLPPGPICSPREEAIEAALYPENTKYLFFFATPDGVNIYNETLEGHNRDQQKYGVSGN